MLALPPYESTEEESVLTKQELCLKLADVVSEILKDPERELIKLEVRWDRGKAVVRALYKNEEAHVEVSTEIRPEDSVLHCGTSDATDSNKHLAKRVLDDPPEVRATT